MAYDEGLAQILRDHLAGHDGIAERKMFGGLCFTLNGHMVCGVHKDGGMARVGKAAEAEALTIPGVAPLSFTGRKMGGMVDVSGETLSDDALRSRIVGLAVAHAASLPPK